MATTNKVINRLVVIILLIAITACSGCNPPEQAVHSQYIDLSNGWNSGTPLHLRPEMPDSNATYTLKLAIRNTNTFAYNSLPLTIDLIDSLHHPTRLNIDIPISDPNGNPLGSGFGNLYQHQIILANDINPRTLRQIVVWHRVALQHNNPLKGITEIGVFAQPNAPN